MNEPKEIRAYLLFMPILGSYYLAEILDALRPKYCLKNSYSGSPYELLIWFLAFIIQCTYVLSTIYFLTV